MELKVWVEGIQRIVCGVTEKTTCQDVVYALAHATGKTGRFTLIERWRSNERLLAPQEHPLKVLQKWGEYSDVQFILQRSALEGAKSSSASQLPPSQMQRNTKDIKADHPPAAVWKPPPNGVAAHAAKGAFPDHNARLSPDSGRGSDRTGGSDTSNSYSDKDAAATNRRLQQQQQYHAGGPIPKSMSTGALSHHPSQYVNGGLPPSGFTPRYTPPAYRGPPPPNLITRPANSSPASGEFPPPYRNPPPPTTTRYRNPSPTMGTMGYQGYHPGQVPHPVVPIRPPHYSPPPTQRSTHLSRHPSRSSLMGGSSHATSRMNQHGLPSRQHAEMPSSRVRQQPQMFKQGQPQPPTDLAELVNLVSAQQSTLYSQQAEIKHCEAETQFLETSSSPYPYYPPMQTPSSSTNSSLTTYSGSASVVQPKDSQIDVVVSEVQRLEEVARRNEEELGSLIPMESPTVEGSQDLVIKNEISQLRHRLAGTDQELQKTNSTLRRLGDEMRSMSLEKNRQRELELGQEIERLQNEIKMIQISSEEGANVSQMLSKEVKEVEDQISQRKAEVEKLIKEMRDANMESLAISPPEESKQFLDGPMKPGTTRKMTGSPRALENAVPTAKNPHGVWV